MSILRIRLISACTLIALLCGPFLMNAQTSDINPYSRYGIGDMGDQYGVQSFSMGQTGIAMNSWTATDSLTPYFINLKNPASYYYNRITTFEAGLLYNTGQFTTQGQTYKNNTASFAYFAMAFPVSKHFGASIGLRPFTSVGYIINTSPNIDSIGIINNNYQGSGGINQAHLGVAYAPFKNLSIGFNLSYLFGNLTNTQNVVYSPNNGAFNSQVSENTDIRSFYLDYGIMYSHKIGSNSSITIGATAALASNINATYSLLSVSWVTAAPQTNIDTVQDSTVKGKLRLPLMIGGGITLKIRDKWTFTLDYTMQNWSQYEFFGQSENLNNSTQMGFGVQYVPKRNIGKFFKRIHYRAGFYYTQTYFDINNTALNDYALTLGLGIPVGGNNIMMRTSMINLGLQLGQMGTTANNLLQEDYIKLMFSFTFDDRWFVKRRYE
jgi:hypothetical protein